ncbi:MAG: hypothetical protein O7G30_11040 [Proteobacteria bacterium]|nr:hypothetical protein [Pseudomonadota bacterium]
MESRARLVLALLVVSLLAVGAKCGGGAGTIIIFEPDPGDLFDEAPIVVSARLSSNFAPGTVQVRVNGVDLIEALGLLPPFQGAGGVVQVGADFVTVSNFDFVVGAQHRVDLEIDGLSPDDHVLDVKGFNVELGHQVTRVVEFTLVDFFTQQAHVVAAAGLPAGPEPIGGGGGSLANATLGEPRAAPPVGVPDGSELRSGFVEAAEALIAGGN